MLTHAGFSFVDTPTDPNELTKFFLRTPLNSDIIFFDYKGLMIKNYLTGIPPFLKFRKERNNATGKVVYVQSDNRGDEVIYLEDDLDRIINIIIPRQIKILNKCAIKSNKNISTPTLARPIGPHGNIKINPLDKGK